MFEQDLQRIREATQPRVDFGAAQKLFHGSSTTEERTDADFLASAVELDILNGPSINEEAVDDAAHLLCDAYSLVSRPLLAEAEQLQRAATLFTAAGYSAKAATVINPLTRASMAVRAGESDDNALESLSDQSYIALVSRDLERCDALSQALIELSSKTTSTWRARYAQLLSALLDAISASSTALSSNGEDRLGSLAKLLSASALRASEDALYYAAQRISVGVGLLRKQLFTTLLHQERLELSEKSRRLFISNRQNSTRELWPSQRAAIRAGALTQPSFVVSLPTSSGKTLLAQLRIARFLESNVTGTVVYVSPYLALATQVTRELRARFDSLGISVTRLTGAYELDLTPPGLGRIIVTTPEKLDSLVRRSGQSETARRVVDNLGLLVLDECHHIGSGARGVTFELLITRLKRRHPSLDIFAMSAATSNAGTVAEWIAGRVDAHIYDKWSPTRRKVYTYKKNGDIVLSGDPAPSITIDVWRTAQIGVCNLVRCFLAANSWPILVLATKKSDSQRLAAMLADQLSAEDGLTPETIATRKALATRYAARFGAESPVIRAVEHGIAMHNTSVPDDLREEVEDAVRDRHLRIISATTTLAEGVHLPFKSVIIPYLSFSATERMERPMFLNIIGRAGRAYTNVEATVVVLDPGTESLRTHLYQTLIPSSANATEINSQLTSGIYASHTKDLRFRSQVLGAIQDGRFGESLPDLLPSATFAWLTASGFQRRALSERTTESIAELRSTALPMVLPDSLVLTEVGHLAAMTGLAGQSADLLINKLLAMKEQGAAWFDMQEWLSDRVSDRLISDICELTFAPFEAVDFLFDPASDVGQPGNFMRSWGGGIYTEDRISRPLRYSKGVLAQWIRGQSVGDFGVEIAPEFLPPRSPRKPADIGSAATDYIEDRLLMLQWMISASLVLTPHISMDLAEICRRSLRHLTHGVRSLLALRLIDLKLDRRVASILADAIPPHQLEPLEIRSRVYALRGDQPGLLSQSDWNVVFNRFDLSWVSLPQS